MVSKPGLQSEVSSNRTGTTNCMTRKDESRLYGTHKFPTNRQQRDDPMRKILHLEYDRWFIGKEMKMVLGAGETVLGLRVLSGARL